MDAQYPGPLRQCVTDLGLKACSQLGGREAYLERGRRSSEKGGTCAQRQLCVVAVACISRSWSCLSNSPGQAALLVPLQEQETGAQRY